MERAIDKIHVSFWDNYMDKDFLAKGKVDRTVRLAAKRELIDDLGKEKVEQQLKQMVTGELVDYLYGDIYLKWRYYHYALLAAGLDELDDFFAEFFSYKQKEE